MAASEYQLIVKSSVAKDLRPIPKATIVRLLDRIEALRSDPLPRQSKKLRATEGLYRLRVGDYRVIYGIDSDERIVTIHYVRHRREAYDDL